MRKSPPLYFSQIWISAYFNQLGRKRWHPVPQSGTFSFNFFNILLTVTMLKTTLSKMLAQVSFSQISQQLGHFKQTSYDLLFVLLHVRFNMSFINAGQILVLDRASQLFGNSLHYANREQQWPPTFFKDSSSRNENPHSFSPLSFEKILI